MVTTYRAAAKPSALAPVWEQAVAMRCGLVVARPTFYYFRQSALWMLHFREGPA